MRSPDAYLAMLVELPNDRARVAAGISDLHELYRELIRAYAPPNVQFERERIIAQLSNPREIAFVLGLLAEGENEAGLLLDLICEVAASEGDAPIAHLVEEAWYYLRTSIDATWQLDDEPPSASAALAYLFAVLHERLQTLDALPRAILMATGEAVGRPQLLRSLRAELAING